jgi:hypothetical protein
MSDVKPLNAFGLTEFDPGMGLVPSEMRKITEKIEKIQQSWVGRFNWDPDDIDSLKRVVNKYATEIENAVADLGYHITVSRDYTDPENSIPVKTNGRVGKYWAPKMELDLDRKPGELDHDQMAYEVQHGEVDGEAFSMDVNGKIHEV